MEPTAPYNVVTGSGKFCLGFPTTEEEESNPYARYNLMPLEIGDTFDCPRIHLVSGMVEKADNPSQVILVYSVKDCVHRMEVAKDDINRMLFPSAQPERAASTHLDNEILYQPHSRKHP
jgi:hypothetical protein